MDIKSIRIPFVLLWLSILCMQGLSLGLKHGRYSEEMYAFVREGDMEAFCTTWSR